MENSNEELFKFLNDSGKIGMLRKHMISFLLSVEGLEVDADTNEDYHYEETDILIKKIESHLHQLAAFQQTADKLFLEMGKGERRALYREAPEILRLFGWYDKIDEAGDIVRKS